VREALGKSTKAAEAWLVWAEQHQLLHRGVPMHGIACHGESWIPLATRPFQGGWPAAPAQGQPPIPLARPGEVERHAGEEAESGHDATSVTAAGPGT
jgi:hypothetical protein